MQEGVKCMSLPTSFLPPPLLFLRQGNASLHCTYSVSFFFVLGDTHTDHYLRINELKSGVLIV